jgi:hypothetical protein
MKKIFLFLLLMGVASVQNTLVRRVELGDSVTAVKGNINDSLDIRLGENWITPQMFGAKGDGVMDDADALNACFNYADSTNVVIPEGVYLTSEPIIFTNDFSNVYNYGVIKVKVGSVNLDSAAVFAVNASNVNFYNLVIDGNSTNAIDGGVLGDQPNLLIYSNKKNISFIGGELKNSMYCGVVFNGFDEFVKFNGMRLTDIGEHGFYISGGSNKNCTFENIRFDRIGVNSLMALSHDVHLFKTRKTSYYLNKDLVFRNIQGNRTSSSRVVTAFLLEHIDGATIDGVRLDDNFQGSFIIAQSQTDDTTKNIHFRNINKSPYNFLTSRTSNITLRDSKIAGTFLYANGFDLIDNVTFGEGGYFETMDLGAVTFDSSHSTVVSNCKFLGQSILGQTIKLSDLQYDLTFKDCIFKISAGGDGFLIQTAIPDTGNTGGKLKFINCDFTETKNLLYGLIDVEDEISEVWFIDCDSLGSIYYNVIETADVYREVGSTKLLLDNCSIKKNASLAGETNFTDLTARNLRGELSGLADTETDP